jgi:hypothetical protein
MSRTLPAVAAVLFAVLPAAGQAPPNPAKAPGDVVAPRVSMPGRTTLSAAPAAAPSPALRYELLPPLRDKSPGNAAVGYLRAAVLRPAWPRDPAEGQALNDKLDRWLEVPVEQLPLPEVRAFVKKYREVYREADAAARMDRCDWHQGRRLGPEDLEALLPGVQANREILRYLQYRHRLELAENRHADAVRTLQTGFRLGKHVGEGRTMIEMLVGIALASSMVGWTEETITRPGSPNLYWALTTLPRPFIDPRPSLEGEIEFMTGVIPGLRELEKGPVSEDQAARALEGAIRELGRTGEPDGGGLGGLAEAVGRAKVMAFAGPAAKKDLLARGWPKTDVDAMPAAQAVILRAVARHREGWDDQAKLFFVPYPTAAAELDRLTRKARGQANANKDDMLYAVFALAYPAIQKVYHAHARLDRRLALLRAVEAVRLHAALNNGAPPKALADVTAVPVPDDPYTGKPFAYAVKGDTFTLTAPPPGGEPASGIFDHEYVVTLRK